MITFQIHGILGADSRSIRTPFDNSMDVVCLCQSSETSVALISRTRHEYSGKNGASQRSTGLFSAREYLWHFDRLERILRGKKKSYYLDKLSRDIQDGKNTKLT